jgi:carboxyl-terminal processing protease
MHQRTWLAILTLPLVTTFTYPMVFQQAPASAKTASAKIAQDPLAGLSDVQDVLTLVRNNYVDVPDMEKVIAGGIEEALERAHPLNAYLSPEEVRMPDPGPAQVGLMLVKKSIWAQVVAVVPESPAAKAGLQVGDVIRKLDGQSVGTLSAWTLERRLRGPAGSELNLVNYDSASGQVKKVVLKREIISRPAIVVNKDTKGVRIELPDLSLGRTSELKPLLSGIDHDLPLILDLRHCTGGDLSETALMAGLFGKEGTLVTIQESGKPDRKITVKKADSAAFPKLAVLQGLGTLGAAEVFSAFLKKQTIPLVGERTAGLGVERTRFPLKQGGALELVNRRWVGAGEEKLDRQGVLPDESLKGLQVGEDPLPKVIEALEARQKKAP